MTTGQEYMAAVRMRQREREGFERDVIALIASIAFASNRTFVYPGEDRAKRVATEAHRRIKEMLKKAEG